MITYRMNDPSLQLNIHKKRITSTEKKKKTKSKGFNFEFKF